MTLHLAVLLSSICAGCRGSVLHAFRNVAPPAPAPPYHNELIEVGLCQNQPCGKPSSFYTLPALLLYFIKGFFVFKRVGHLLRLWVLFLKEGACSVKTLCKNALRYFSFLPHRQTQGSSALVPPPSVWVARWSRVCPDIWSVY